MNIQKVLIADDDLDDIELLKETILEHSTTINISYDTDGVQLMDELLKSTIPDILILDLKMPCKEGKECISEIRGTEDLKHLVIIVYSTTSTGGIKEECLSLGANFFVTKPTELVDLIKFSQAIIEGKFDHV